MALVERPTTWQVQWKERVTDQDTIYTNCVELHDAEDRASELKKIGRVDVRVVLREETATV